MLRKLLVIVAISCVSSCVKAGTTSIGSVVAQGQLRIDGHPIQGSGTVFDGTRVETGSESQSTADLRLSNGTKITLHNNSCGTLYGDHFVLVRGEAEMTATGSFRAEVSGLLIQPSEPRTSELISIGPGGDVRVLARTGQLQIVGDHGQVLAQMHTQEPRSFIRTGDRDWQIGEADSRGFGDGGGDGGGDDHDHHHRHHHHSR